jgi:heat-inducible transcriptional repressor
MMLTSRQRSILSAIIKEYINTAIPVGSKELVEKYHFKLSPATIRNEMSELDKKGYIHQPYTSAGRVPTDLGYRYFIDALMKKRKMTEREQRELQVEFLKTKTKYKQLARATSQFLSQMTNSLALSGFFDSEEFWNWGMPKLLSQPEFADRSQIQKLSAYLEKLEENSKKISKKIKNKKVDIYIGKKNPLVPLENCAMVVSGFKTKDNKKGFIILIGPKRMKYAKNISLVDYITKLLSGSFIILMFIYYI